MDVQRDGWEKEEGQKREVALCLSHVTVHTGALEKGGQAAPEYGKVMKKLFSIILISLPLLRHRKNKLLCCGAKNLCVFFYFFP